jgi:hypothetical protein
LTDIDDAGTYISLNLIDCVPAVDSIPFDIGNSNSFFSSSPSSSCHAPKTNGVGVKSVKVACEGQDKGAKTVRDGLRWRWLAFDDDGKNESNLLHDIIKTSHSRILFLGVKEQ